MAYDEKLAEKVRRALTRHRVEEKKMMGGLTFMVNGKMCVGVLKDDLMVRLDSEIYEVALKRKGAREMDIMKRPMPGFVFVGPEGTKAKKNLDYWLKLGLDFNKKAKASKKKN
jgi:TfoX/Sxy family transcriptional regulator of competence genes